jgi:protein-disulfide isomerase
MARQRQTLLLTLSAVLLGVLIVGFVAFQQLGGTPAPSLAVVVVSASPAHPTAATTSASAQASAQSPAGDSPAPSGIALYQPGPANTTPASIPAQGRTLGNASAPVTIDLYGDFRCSACFQFTEGGTAAAINDQLVATGKAKLVWHDFTVIDLMDKTHASRDAANAAWCAADQNKFWVMHDWLYANQSPTEAPDAFTTGRLLAIGEAAGLDMATFAPCVQSGTHDKDIAAEQSSLPAAVAGHGTPSVLVNGVYVDAAFNSVKAAVAAAD